MVTLNILRMLVDISAFGCVAGAIAAGRGASGAFGGMLLQSLCFGLSCAAGEKRWRRLVCLIPMALCWWGYRGSPADCLLMLPTGAYILWLVWRGEYVLDHERQQRIFSLFWKVALGVLFFGMLTEKREAVAEVVVLYTMMLLMGSVFLMRSLRHEAEVYTGRAYQLINGAAVLTVAAAGYLVSRRGVLEGAAAVLKGIYRSVLLPVFYLLIGIFLTGIKLLGRLFGNLKRLPEGSPPGEGMGEMDISHLLEEAGAPMPFAELVRKALIVLLVCAGIALLALFFRWLNGKGGARAEAEIQTRTVRTDVAPPAGAALRRGDPTVRSIRAQYRKFLRLCIRRGLVLRADTTSLDVDRFARRAYGDEGLSREIRALYLPARYGGRADREAARKMKGLLTRVQKDEARGENEKRNVPS